MDSVPSIASLLNVREATVRTWIRSGQLDIVTDNGAVLLPRTEKNSAFVLEKLKKSTGRTFLDRVPSEIREYDRWHHTLDELVWLLKVCYSQSDDIKRRKFRLEQLFSNYLASGAVTLRKLRGVFASNSTPKVRLATDDLKRGWYNELAYAIPLRPSTLGLSFSDIELNKSSSAKRFAFPSWRIVTAYYSIYFFLRSVTLHKQPSFRLQQHGATIACFKASVLSPLRQVIWKFPFDIGYYPGVRVQRKELPVGKLPHARFGFSRHPRSPNRSPIEIFDNIHALFRKQAKAAKNPTAYTLFDYFHDFRVWANYLDINNLLSLWGAGYKAILDQNLSVLLFFIGGVSELCFIACLGERRFLRELQGLYDLLVANNAELLTFAQPMDLVTSVVLHGRKRNGARFGRDVGFPGSRRPCRAGDQRPQE